MNFLLLRKAAIHMSSILRDLRYCSIVEFSKQMGKCTMKLSSKLHRKSIADLQT